VTYITLKAAVAAFASAFVSGAPVASEAIAIALARPAELTTILTDIRCHRSIFDVVPGLDTAAKSRFRKSARDDKWNFCLTAGTLCPANQERP
jgi:hypothetical protein